MNPSNPSHSTVKHTPLVQHQIAAGLADVGTIVSTGTASAAVQGSPVAKQALGVLQTALGAVQTAYTNKLAVMKSQQTAIKTLAISFASLATALRSYEAAVNVLAGGDGSIINQAGLLTRAQKAVSATLGTVVGLLSKPGKLPAQGVVSWPEVAGATSYAIEANFTPATPAGPWTQLNSGTSRRRVLTAPAAGAQFLVRVAALGSDGSQSNWSDPVLVTAK